MEFARASTMVMVLFSDLDMFLPSVDSGMMERSWAILGILSYQGCGVWSGELVHVSIIT